MFLTMFESRSAAKLTPKDYSWYQYKGKRTISILDGHAKYDMAIEPDERYGVRKSLKYNYIVDASDPSIEFKVNDKQLTSLYKRSKGWGGRVGRYTVRAGEYGSLDKPNSSVNMEAKPPKAVRISVNTTSRRKTNADDPSIRASLKSTNSGLDRAVFLFSEEVLPGEWRYYYDIDKCLEKYRDSKGKLRAGWDRTVQTILDTKTRLETDVTLTNYKGNTIHLLTVSVED